MSKPRLDLLRFLKQAQAYPTASSSSYLPSSQPPLSFSSASPIYVLGNPSADLDSIISAIIYSYFATRVVSSTPPVREKGENKVLREYIPLINLPDVHGGKELARLRPEFITALRLAVDSHAVRGDGISGETGAPQSADEGVLEGSAVLTIADLKAARLASAQKQHPVDMNVMMVDWNALPKLSGGARGIQGFSDSLPAAPKLSITGCIDHREDESFVPQGSEGGDPRRIQAGVGSCTSLVVRELRERGLWSDRNHDHDEASESADTDTDADISIINEAQAAKLAMAAILIDTANMTAKSKVSPVDSAAVAFLEAKIRAGVDAARSSRTTSTATNNDSGDAHVDASGWDRQSFYDAIALAKENSVNNLTVSETLGRDYKEWTETESSTAGSSGTVVKLGICSMVKPLSWLMEKCTRESKTTSGDATTNKALSTHLTVFASERNLDLVAVMTAFRDPVPNGEFRRELLLYALSRKCLAGADRFERVAVGKLGLEEGIYGGDFSFAAEDADGDGEEGCYRRVWRQGDVAKSRKQVAPLLRGAVRGDGGV